MSTHNLTLPVHRGEAAVDEIALEPPSSRQILRICLNIKYLIDKIIPTIFEVELVTCRHSRILNEEVIKLVYEACGGDKNDEKSLQKYKSVLLFSLLKVSIWYEDLSFKELHNAELYELRSIACQHLCRIIIEREEEVDLQFLFMGMLLRRFVVNENDEDSEPTSVLELATDIHSTVVIGSSGFQRCLKWLWRGWIIQSREEPTVFVRDQSVSSMRFKSHFNPERIKTPMYQNILQIMFSIIFLILYTGVVNDKDSIHVDSIDAKECLFYLFTLGYILDEITKLYYIGSAYLSFWNAFNDTLYSIICVSIFLRILSVSPIRTGREAEYWDMISYRILSCAAPFVWSRLLLFLEAVPFVGVMLVVLKHMMTESIVFFVLLFLMMIGFLQGFIGLDSSDGKNEITGEIMNNLIITVLGSGSFSTFKEFAPPYAAILYYGYYFIVSVILLNILIALYANAYDKVVDNAGDEYMALMCQKTLRFIRAPDEDVYVAPLNVIELILYPVSILLPKSKWIRFSRFLMTLLYSPILVVVALREVRAARRIQYNRIKRLEDDANETDEAWNLHDGFVDSGNDIFSTGGNSGIHETQVKNGKSLRLQHEAENADPKFRVSKEWYRNVEKSVQPVEEGYSSGIGWELFDLYNEVQKKNEESEKKIDELTKSVNQLVELVKELNLQKKN